MLKRFGGMKFRLMLFSLALVYSSIEKSFRDTLLLANFTKSVIFPFDKEYRRSVVMANYDCKFLCPYIVLRPITSREVAQAIEIAQRFNVSLSTRGGGHSYTCQGAKAGGIMLDMRTLKNMELHVSDESSRSITSMTIGTGYTWGEVLKELRKVDKHLVAVPGQCTSVGVAGFALHGGVHFGGLSELYGLASDNILGLTAVVANGSTVELTSNSCVVDGLSTRYSEECRGLFFAFRGAGSSYGVVTSLTLQLHIQPNLQSALSILSLKISDSYQAQKYLSSYMEKIPKEVSLTLFGLDAYFKAYSFTLLFSSKKRRAFFYDIQSLISINSDPVIHFIVEASWVKNGSSTRVIENNKRSRESKSKEPVDEIFEKLKLIHENLRIENIFMRSNNDNEKKNFYGSTDAVKVEFQEKMVRNSTTPTAIVGTVRNWLLTDGTWSVPSYDLVWGAGHSYGGATIIVDKEYEEITIEQSFERMKLHENKRTGKCSDCVLVFHRIGEKLRSGNKRVNPKNFNEERNRRDHVAQVNVKSEGSNSRDIEIEDTLLRFESFNPFRQNGSLWVEIDCGHFYPKRDSWPACSSFISESQKQLDDIVPRNRSAHYPNVPNLNTADWKEQYYGAEGYRFLQKMKNIWDPNNFFYHAQSVTLSDEDSVVRLIDNRHDKNHRNNSEFNHHVSSDYKRNGREDVYSQNPKLEERSADRVVEELRFFEASRLNSDNQLQRNIENRNRDKIRQNVKKTTLQKHCTRMYDRAANADPRNLFDVTRAIRSLFLTIQSVTKKILAVLKRTPLTKLI